MRRPRGGGKGKGREASRETSRDASNDAGRGVSIELVVLEAVPELIVPAVLALEDVDLGPNVV